MDIVERLGSLRLSNEDYEVVVDAIDEIERLREVLKSISEVAKIVASVALKESE